MTGVTTVTAQAKMSVRREVLAMYAACMRSARRCPEWKQREMMKAYVRMKFRDEAGARDTDRVRRLLVDAREELDRMEYYHSVYAEKQRLQAEARGQVAAATSPASAAAAAAFPASACPSCGSAYQPPTAKFCSNCGEKRT